MYANKLNSIIETYGLTTYDQPLYTQDPYQSGVSSSEIGSGDYVWNVHRGAYTDSDTLAQDDAWSAYASGNE